MGVLNLTPDSFSDGGRWTEPRQAIEHGLRMAAEGADLLDLGAESTRPGGGVYGGGADEVPVDEELRRLLPVLEGLRAELELPLSVDTRKGAVARAALDAGADLVNDVGTLRDPDLLAAVAEAGCPVVAMHSRGDLKTMQRGIRFEDAVAEVMDELRAAVDRAAAAGVERSRVILDPGLGFGKTADHNLRLLRELDRFHELGHPLLVGASRKSFLAEAGAVDGERPPPDRRLGGSLAAVGWAARAGVSIVRVHDVADTVQFLKVWNAIDLAERRARTPKPAGSRWPAEPRVAC